jgi:outer membrane receptor protein involved in Fe transport
MRINVVFRTIATLIPFALYANFSFAEEESGKRIEEVVVYGAKDEATVSDTSIAITAMDENFLKDLGIQGPNEMVNFIPATTRTDWDVKIRGVGRNFRGLGGDPGIGTYYNGMYSSDFGIASTEGGLYDIKRIEVLRGPQGTLYGRNSIGGVINYVTNQPNHDEFEASVRMMLGEYNTTEAFGVVSGPVSDNLAYRLVGVKRKRDGAVEGMAGTEDVEGINDQNFSIALDWDVRDDFSVTMRFNDRRSLREGNFGNGGHGITSEGPCVGVHPITEADDCDPRYRVNRDTGHYAPGFRAVDQTYYNTYGDLADNPYLGAVPWIHPITGEPAYGAYNRPGVDVTRKWPNMPSTCYMDANCAAYNIGDADAPNVVALTNDSALEEFDHRSLQLTFDWEISDKVSARYLYNDASFEYYFNRDNDFSNSFISDNNDTVHEDVTSYSHELRVFWEVGDRWTATSGLYAFKEDRRQLYGIRERAAQGRVTNPAIYGPEGAENLLLEALSMVGWIVPECMHYSDTELNSAAGGYGAWCPPEGRTAYDQYQDNAAVYEHDNYVESENLAFYTQGDFRFTDTFSVTVGARYSKDKRKGLEQRGGYEELHADQYGPWLPQAINLAVSLFHPELYDTIDGGMLGDWGVLTGAPAAADPSVTGLAAMNVAMGNATWSGDPDFPITPVCELTAETCDRPLRVNGIPISWGSRIFGEYEPDSELTFRVNFNWEPTENILLYFGVTEGYRSGGWNMGGPDNRVLLDIDGEGICDTTSTTADLNAADPTTSGCDIRALLNYDGEEITSYEVGYKGTHLDGRLQLNMAVYYYDYTNYQDHVERWETNSSSFSLPNVTLPDGSPLGPPPGRGPVEVTVNIPKAVNKGFELDGIFLATDDLTVGGNYSYTISEYDAPYTFFNEDDPRYPRHVFGGDLSENPCDMTPELKALYCLEIDGYQLQGIPKHKATVWASYNWHLDAGMLTWLGSYSYTGEYDTSPFSRPWDEVPERDRIDMRLTFAEKNDRWSASLFVDNVMDDTYIRSSDMDARRSGYGGNWSQRVVSLYPRYWGLDMTYNFGR